jgi:predicted membrane-bound dolichyl-phosphate-mannose-protein mannosyltransferase
LVWVGLVAAVCAIVYLAGGRTERSFGIPLVPASGLYWAVAVPAYVRAHYRAQ